jgi:Kdo2-lipid IVA lauroyltransferase/acyltransferase
MQPFNKQFNNSTAQQLNNFMKTFLTNTISYLLVGLLILLSLVPLRILLRVSPVLAWLLEHAFRYRNTVVTTNLRNSFPNSEDQVIARIRSRFYLHFADMFFETISLLTAPKKTIQKRCQLDGESVTLLDSFFQQGQSVMVLSGHYGNWEYQPASASQNASFLVLPVYRPLKNGAFNWYIGRIRLRFSDGLIPDRQVARTVISLKKQNKQALLGVLSDQFPGYRHAIWLPFLNQDTAVFSGPEKLAKMLKLPVVFLSTRKASRGNYNMHCQLITDHPESLPEEAITRTFLDMLEKEILAAPEYYLWSHDRWKHPRK